ncbi:MAG: glycosyltransferase [Bacteroidota bacterium]
MVKKITLSIILPVYNAGPYLVSAVDSILNQTFADFELILVNDGSSDGSAEICDFYALKDARVKVLHQENGGICNARNNALNIAQGEYIGFSDHDDITDLNAFHHGYKAILKFKPDMVKYGKIVEFVDHTGKIYRTDKFHFEDAVYTKEDISQNYLSLRQKGIFKNVWNGFFKRTIIIENKVYFDESFKNGGEDHDFCNTFSRFTNKLVTIKDLLYVHYIRTGFSTSSKVNPEIQTMLVTEGVRLKETIDLLGYPLADNLDLFGNQIFESVILPIIRYHLRQKVVSNLEIIKIIKLIREKDFFVDGIDALSLIQLMKRSPKLGLFSYAFLHGKYMLLLWMIKLRYVLMK